MVGEVIMMKGIGGAEARTHDQLREHYEVEKRLADQLRSATREERRFLYSSVYDELFRSIPHHPQLTRKEDAGSRDRTVASQVRLLKRYLGPASTFMELGPGDCRLSLAVSNLVRKVYAIDVSSEITRHSSFPKNFSLILSDGSSISLPADSVDVAYSYQLMEHLHPDDALAQLKNIFKVLVRGGVYICVTPNRLNGPHDISRFFDEVATGFHLREYTNAELAALFRQIGFSEVKALLGFKGYNLRIPTLPVIAIEWLIERLGKTIAKRLACWLPIRVLIGVKLVARK